MLFYSSLSFSNLTKDITEMPTNHIFCIIVKRTVVTHPNIVRKGELLKASATVLHVVLQENKRRIKVKTDLR